MIGWNGSNVFGYDPAIVYEAHRAIIWLTKQGVVGRDLLCVTVLVRSLDR